MFTVVSAKAIISINFTSCFFKMYLFQPFVPKYWSCFLTQSWNVNHSIVWLLHVTFHRDLTSVITGTCCAAFDSVHIWQQRHVCLSLNQRHMGLVAGSSGILMFLSTNVVLTPSPPWLFTCSEVFSVRHMQTGWLRIDWRCLFLRCLN